MKSIYLICCLVLLSACLSQHDLRTVSHNGIELEHSLSKQIEWISLPAHFQPFDKASKFGAVWHPTSVEILNGKYEVFAGPYKTHKYPNDAAAYSIEAHEADYYAIDIEIPRRNSSIVVLTVAIPIDYVAPEKILADAATLIHFDKKSHIVTWDLGNGVFKARIRR